MIGLNQILVGDDANLYVVGFFQMGLGRGNAGSPFGVVGQQEQTFAGLVETADGSDPVRGTLRPTLPFLCRRCLAQ